MKCHDCGVQGDHAADCSWWNTKVADTPRQPASAQERLEELQHKIQMFLDGDYPNPRLHRPGQCEHKIWYWESCESCNDAWLKSALDLSRAT